MSRWRGHLKPAIFELYTPALTGMLNNGLILMNLRVSDQMIVRGLIVLLAVEIPNYSAIDYYGMIDVTGPRKPKTGDTVIFGFRGQAFVTRANIVGNSGIAPGNPQVTSIEDIFARPTDWLERKTS